MNIAAQILAAAESHKRLAAERFARMTVHQRRLHEKRKKIRAAITKDRKTTEAIAEEVALPLNYVQKILVDHYEEWGVSRTRNTSNESYRWWKD